MENTLQELNQLTTLAGLLGAFGFAAVIQLLSMDRKGRVITATILVFTAATLTFLLAFLMFILTFSAATELGKLQPQLDSLGTIGVLVTYAGVYVLEAGIGLAGWIRSKATGIATTVMATITVCLTTIVIASVTGQFM
jgi:hypothetical protein